MRYRGGARRSSGEDPVWQLYRLHVTTVDTVDVQPAYIDGDAKRLDCDLDAVKTVDGPAVNQGYGILDGYSVSQVASAISVPTVYNLKVSGYGHRVNSSKATVFTLGGGLKVILFDVEIGWLPHITTGEYSYTAPVPFAIKEVVASVSNCDQWRFDRCRITLSGDKKVLNFVGNSDRATTSDGTNADNGYYIPFYGIMVVRV